MVELLRSNIRIITHSHVCIASESGWDKLSFPKTQRLYHLCGFDEMVMEKRLEFGFGGLSGLRGMKWAKKQGRHGL